MKIPHFKNEIENGKQEAVQLRTDIDGQVANQDPHLPLILPKLPGHFYYLFGKPIVTEGIDGVGLGLILHHQRLGQIFDIWCLHIPIMDRTTFTDLVKLVEGTVRSENNRSPNRPIDLVGESIGGCLALAVAAQNPDVDLMLILSNPATCFKKSPLQLLTTYLEIMPEQLHLSAPYMLCLVTVGRINYHQVKRKVKYFNVCCRDVRFVNLMRAEDGVDLVTIIMGASFYRRARYLDYASDYLPPRPSEFKKIHESLRWIEVATSPVMLSTLEDGKVVRGLAGIPSEGPVLLVGYHMLLGLEMVPIVSSFWAKRNILLRGIAHPMMYRNLRNGESPLIPDISTYDILRIMGAVPVSATNFYKLLSSNAHVLLYPGGMREALHRKGEEYKLFWPEQSEFVRMAARFGATIIPFGSVGEDDIGQLLVDYDDLMEVPHIKAKIKEVAEAVMQLRTDDDRELGNQDPHLPLILPKLPGRFYNLFGKPIETEGRKRELRNRDKSQELYLVVKSEVERCMAYLKDKREHDPYRNILPRTIYQAMHGFDCEVPTFKL